MKGRMRLFPVAVFLIAVAAVCASAQTLGPAPCRETIHFRGITICNQLHSSFSMTGEESKVLDDVKSLVIIRADLAAAGESDIWKDAASRKTVVTEIHKEIARMRARNGFYTDAKTLGMEAPVQGTSDKSTIFFLDDGSRAALEERRGSLAPRSTFSIWEYERHLLAMDQWADVICRENGYECKEPRRKRFFFF